MIDWWQALLLSVSGALVGGLITLAVSYATHGWTADAARKAEERQYIRQHRRERMKPIFDFLDVARRCGGEEVVIGLMQQAYQQLAATQTPVLTWEDFEKGTRKEWSVPGIYEVLRAFFGAHVMAPTPVVELTLLQVVQAILKQQYSASPQQTSEEEVRAAITSAEQLVERYLAEV